MDTQCAQIAFPREVCDYPRGQLERLPKWLNLVPMVIQWIALSIRYRSLSLPTAVNPAIPAGGLAGEGKLDYFAVMGALARSFTADFTGIVNQGPSSSDVAHAAARASGLAYPFIAKPNIGWCGFGVRLIRNHAELATYCAQFPQGECIVMQEFLPQEGEAGLFYQRAPGEAKGRLIGILLRHFPRVTGDGASSIAELMASDPRLRRLGRDRLSEPCCDTTRIPAPGEMVRIATIGSSRIGGIYEDATSLITPALSDAIDAIAQDMTDFHVGRFDVRYDNLAALARGTGFKIIEVNGAGSEAVHAWDPRLSLRQAYGIVFAKQRMLFATGDAMRRLGHKPASLGLVARLYLRQQRLIGRYPASN